MNGYDESPYGAVCNNGPLYNSGVAYFQSESIVELVAKRLGRDLRYVAQLYPTGWVVSFWMPSNSCSKLEQ